MEFSGKTTGVGCHFLLQMLRIWCQFLHTCKDLQHLWKVDPEGDPKPACLKWTISPLPRLSKDKSFLSRGKGVNRKGIFKAALSTWPHRRITRMLRPHLEQYIPISGDGTQCWRRPGDRTVQPDCRDNLCRVLAFPLLSPWCSHQTKQKVMGSLGRLD